ncbi:MAG: endoglucanase [Saprospiraceae bacterium]|nr:MAG: endoglucanase [Saprospiraceae bacterium]
MRTIFTILGLSLMQLIFAQEISPFIHIDQFGYQPEATKVAVLSDPITGFNSDMAYSPSAQIEVREAGSGNVVFSAAPEAWNNGATHNLSGDRGWWLDFSVVTTPGTYYVYDPGTGERSGDFEVKPAIYASVLKAAFRMFYYNRCNAAKTAPYAEPGWTDGPSFLNPLQDANCRYVYNPSNTTLEKDLSGGWFDAGDYNKYVTFAEQAMHNLIWAYREHPQAFSDANNIPESGNGLPDLIDEIKWELDWLLKMNNADGSTHIKMGSIDFGDNAAAPPSQNFDRRYYGPTCSSAAIAVAGMFAHAALVFRDFSSLQAYADLLETRAETAWQHVLPRLNANNLDEACDDGTINAGDADWDSNTQTEKAVAAAIYLYELTEDQDYLDYVTTHYQEIEPIANDFWGPYKASLTDALLQLATLPNVPTMVADNIRISFQTAVSNNWNDFFGFNPGDLYRSYMPSWSYHWGSNSVQAGYGNLNQVIVKYGYDQGDSATYHLNALGHLHFLHGVNPLGLVYLSNMYDLGGDRCVDEIYHTWFADGTDWDNSQTSVYGPPPGYLVGGPNANFSIGTISPPANQPAQKSYLDFNDGWPNNSWELSEPAIYYQAAYIRLLAGFHDVSLETKVENPNFSVGEVMVFPNPSSGHFTLSDLPDYNRIKVVDATGKIRLSILAGVSRLELDLSSFESGSYFVEVFDGRNRLLQKTRLIVIK